MSPEHFAVPKPASDYSGPDRLTMRTSRSFISIGRYVRAGREGSALIATAGEDAFLAILQLRSHAPHRIWDADGASVAPCAGPGTIHVLDLNETFSAEHDTDIDSLHVHLPRAALDDLAADIGAAPIAGIRVPLPWSTPDPVIPQVQALILEALAGAEAPGRLYSDHLIQIVARHIAYTYGGLRPYARVQGGLAPWQSRRAQEMIGNSLAKQVSLREVAKECGLSSSHFARAFKASTGMTPHGWLQACRIDRARDLLRQPSRSLAEIAADCGFADQSHLTRIFRRATGQTPGAWRSLREPSPPVSAP